MIDNELANEKIDIVILWVDGNDPKWQEEKAKFQTKKGNDITNNINRYRDWNLLKYWFRGVEKNAPWVNKIHFVTWGHIPSWLNVKNPKLNIVKHEDFIPKEFLPTFNSNVIQYYLDRIEGLSEKFIMFDDDMFILKKVKKTDFFINDKICDTFIEYPFYYSVLGDKYPHSLLNNMQSINQHYSKISFYKKNKFKILNYKYGIKNVLKNFFFFHLNKYYFLGIYSSHICQCYTKKHYKLFWKYCEKELIQASKNKFRDYSDLTTFLVRYIELLEGDFVPRNIKFGKRFELKEDNKEVYESILNKKYHIICINDSNAQIDFNDIQKELQKCFNNILPDKCSFEK